MKVLIAALILIVSLAADDQPIEPQKWQNPAVWHNIKAGQTPEQTRQILGEPLETESTRAIECWYYSETPTTDDSGKTIRPKRGFLVFRKSPTGSTLQKWMEPDWQTMPTWEQLQADYKQALADQKAAEQEERKPTAQKAAEERRSKVADVIPGSILQSWGKKLITRIETRFSRADGLYQHTTTQTFSDYAWGQGVMARALTAAAKVDPSYVQRAKKQADEFHRRYWCYQNGTSGYNASYGNCGDRYYDDNAWIALALLELYQLTLDAKYLGWARGTVVFCMTGENGPNDTPNGGIRWRESSTSGVSVCSTAPTMLSNLIIHQLTGIESYKTDGLRLYNWLMNSNLRYSSGIFHETNEGPLGYQTAVVTQTALRLYQITGNNTYLQQAQSMASAMKNEFINSTTGALRQTGKWGGHDMTNAYVELFGIDRNLDWLNIVTDYLVYLHDNCKDKATGLYPTCWDNTTANPSVELIDNASVAMAYWKMAGVN